MGVVDLSLSPDHTIIAEVAALKLGYFGEFKDLLSHIAREMLELLLEVDSVAGARFAPGDPGEVPPSILVFHLRRLLRRDMLPQAIETITQDPYSRLVRETELVDVARSGIVDPAEIARNASRLYLDEGGALADMFFGRSPRSLPEMRKRESIDTPENRYVKAFLMELSALLRNVQPILERGGKQVALREVRAWITQVDDWLTRGIWREVGELSQIPSNSQVLQRRDGYRQVLESDLTLRYGLRLPWERGQEIADTIGDIRPVNELYEYWCYFALRKVIRMLCGSETAVLGDFYEEENSRLRVNLRRGRQSRLTYDFRAASGAIRVHLFYSHGFTRLAEDHVYAQGSYSTQFKPDFSILVQGEGHSHWLHFDAKYRLDMEQWKKMLAMPTAEELENQLAGASSAEDPSAEDVELFKKGDLYKMHTYRDAVMKSRGSYVLFPGAETNASLFVKHEAPQYRAQYPIPGVGAFPLRPQEGGDQLIALAHFLRDVFSNLAQSGSIYSEEHGFPNGP